MLNILTSLQLFGAKKFETKPYFTGNFTVQYQKASDPENIESKFVIVQPLGDKSDEMVLNLYDDDQNEIESTYYLKWTDSANFSIYKDEEFEELITPVTFIDQSQPARGNVKDVSFKLTLYGLTLELIIYDSKKGISRVIFTSQRPPAPWYQQFMPIFMMLPMIINMCFKKPMPQQQAQQQQGQNNQEKKDDKKEENKDSKEETKDGEANNETNNEANQAEKTADASTSTDDNKVKTE